jgi:hypothetical protein
MSDANEYEVLLEKYNNLQTEYNDLKGTKKYYK